MSEKEGKLIVYSGLEKVVRKIMGDVDDHIGSDETFTEAISPSSLYLQWMEWERYSLPGLWMTRDKIPWRRYYLAQPVWKLGKEMRILIMHFYGEWSGRQF
ncbi:hypothetical protein EJ377_00465 [Chryseobacterium arthrosphaerae]|uniref:Uncharacterized protein n=1 Tax=Chryseobacterium arthrosphaerae TaxID=651561 RepID=A0A3S0N7U0_9FLAO|nr:hypothetical protein EJ377_00465 [Chryseobacterium arthrosphaerae]